MQGTKNAEPCLVGAIPRSCLAVVISEHLLMLNAEGIYYSKANHANNTIDNRTDGLLPLRGMGIKSNHNHLRETSESVE